MYGFESEVRYKYDAMMFDMFEEVFNHIPLFTIINRSIFVVHAGLFHTAEVTLDDLQEIDRYCMYYIRCWVEYDGWMDGIEIDECIHGRWMDR